jgi:hypothetical protein
MIAEPPVPINPIKQMAKPDDSSSDPAGTLNALKGKI